MASFHSPNTSGILRDSDDQLQVGDNQHPHPTEAEIIWFEELQVLQSGNLSFYRFIAATWAFEYLTALDQSWMQEDSIPWCVGDVSLPHPRIKLPTFLKDNSA